MNDWFVELAGHESDLSVLPRILTAPHLCVVKKGNRYLLKSIELDRLTSDQEVYAHAKNIINVLNGLAGVYIEGFVNVALSGGVEWIDDSGPQRSIFVEAKSAFRIRVGGVVVNGGEVVPTGLTTQTTPLRLRRMKRLWTEHRALQYGEELVQSLQGAGRITTT